jgi:hypothetical protein
MSHGKYSFGRVLRILLPKVTKKVAREIGEIPGPCVSLRKPFSSTHMQKHKSKFQYVPVISSTFS